MSEEEILYVINYALENAKANKHEHIGFRIEYIQGLLDLYNAEKEKNRQCKMRIEQLENEITARIEDANKNFISKDKIKRMLKELKEITYIEHIEDTSEVIKFIKRLLEE